MMPSRGVRVAPRIFQAQCRNFSSRRIPPSLLRNAILPTSSPTSPWRRSTPFLISSIQATRNASTQPATLISSSSTSHIDSTTTTPSSAEPSSAFPSMDTITLDDIDLSNPDIPTHIAAIPEKLGYLQEIGLNYGWGPTSIIEWTIEHFHIVGGLPWWGSIAATAIVFRLVFLPFFIRSSDVMARSSALMPLTKPVTERMQLAQKEKRTQDVAVAWQELMTIRKRAGVSMRAQFTPIIVQAVFGYCGFKLLRACAALPVPGFKTDGFLWLQDLTVPDPYLILPAIMAGTVHLLIRVGGETGAAAPEAFTPGMRTFMLYGFPGLILVTTGWLPGAVCVYLAAGGFLGVIQSLAFQRPALRAWLGIAPIYRPNKADTDKGILSAAMSANPFGNRADTAAKPKKKATPRSAQPMAPTWQAPTLRRNDGKIIDVKPVIKMATPSAGAATFTPKARTADKAFKAEEQAARTAAEAYEKRAQRSKEMGKGRR